MTELSTEELDRLDGLHKAAVDEFPPGRAFYTDLRDAAYAAFPALIAAARSLRLMEAERDELRGKLDRAEREWASWQYLAHASNERADKAEAELSALKHDIGRHMDALLAADEALHKERDVTARMRLGLMQCRAIAKFERETPTPIPMTALSIIEREAAAALAPQETSND